MKPKRMIVIGLTTILVIGTTSAAAYMINAKESNINKPIPVIQENTSSEAPQETSNDEVVNIPKQQQKTAQIAPQQVTTPTVPTIEELAIKYGWDKMAGGLAEGGTLSNYTGCWPQFFTESEREASFKYLYDIGYFYASRSITNRSVSNLDVNFFVTRKFPGLLSCTTDRWIDAGKKSWGRYQPISMIMHSFTAILFYLLLVWLDSNIYFDIWWFLFAVAIDIAVSSSITKQINSIRWYYEDDRYRPAE